MANPTSSNLHLSAPLTNVAVGAIQSENVFISRKVFPTVPVVHQFNKFRTFNIADFYRNEMAPRAPGTETYGTGWNVGEDGYLCNVFGLHHDIDDQDRANSDSVFALDSVTTMSLTNKALIKQDESFVKDYMTTGKWATELAGVDSAPTNDQFIHWGDDASDPVETVNKVRTRMLLLSGKKFNKMTVSYDVNNALMTNPSILDRIKYSGGISNSTPVNVTEQALAALFKVDEYIVSEGIYNAAEEGLPMDGKFLVENTVLLSYSPRAASIFEMSAGYVFEWSKFLGASSGVRVKKFRMENLSSDRIEIESAFDTKLVSNVCGALLTDVLATA